MATSFLQQNWLQKRIHISRHIAWVSISLLVGVALAPGAGDTFVGNEWLLIAASMFVTVAIRRNRYMILVSIVVGLTVGLWRGSVEQIGINDYREHYGHSVVVTGTVSEDTSYGVRGDQRMRLSNVAIGGKHLVGTIWVSSDSKLDIKRGDVIRLEGILDEGFGNIPASMFKAKLDSIERPNPGDIGRRARDWFGNGVYRSMPEPDADFALAYLVGQRLNLSDSLNDQLRTVGLIHAVVASGYHLTVLIGVIRVLFVRVSKYLTALFSVGVIGGFILITGFSASMTRAGLVSSLSLLAWYYGRVIHPLVLLPFAAALTVIYQPEYIWGDIGWYLSFAAFTGVILLAPLLHNYFWGKRRPSVLREILVATCAAQLVTLPITIYVFGYYSVYALLANLLVVPLIPLTMLLTFISGVAGLIIPTFAQWFGYPVTFILKYMATVVHWIANLPGSRSEVVIGMTAVILGYVAIAIFTFYLWRATHHNFRRDTDLQKPF